jgi:hypothetical protein
MIRRLIPSLLAASLLLTASLTTGCFRNNTTTAPPGTDLEGPPPGPPVTGPRTTTTTPPAGPSAPSGPTMGSNPAITTPTGKTVSGAVFNKLFPKDGNGYNVTFAQEKSGFAMADVTKGGKKVAQISVNDLTANPTAINKYKSSTTQIGGFPATSVGSQGTAILVGSRYQVQVRSTDASFTAQDREAWLTKFDLSGLAQVK